MLTEDDANRLKEIAGRIRDEAVSILVVAARDEMLKAGIRRQAVAEVIMGMEKVATQQFAAIDDEMIQLVLDDSGGIGEDPDPTAT